VTKNEAAFLIFVHFYGARSKNKLQKCLARSLRKPLTFACIYIIIDKDTLSALAEFKQTSKGENYDLHFEKQ
jgi:hypothetical protein